MKYWRKSGGFSLIEAAIVLGVIGLVLGGIWVAAAATLRSMEIAQTSKDILYIADKAPRMFPAHLNSAPSGGNCGSGAYVDITSAGIAGGLFPKNWVSAGSVITPPIGETVYFQQWGNGSMGGVAGDIDDSGAVSLVIDKIANSDCRQILAAVAGATMQRGMFGRIDVGGTGSGLCNWTSPVTYEMPYSGTIGSSCRSDVLNKIQFVFLPG